MTVENITAAPGVTPEAAAAQDEAPTIIEARGPAPMSEELTPEELAYFNSRGNDVSGLGLPPEAPAAPAYVDPTPAPAPAAVAPPAPRAPVTPDSAPLAPAVAAPPAATSPAVDPNVVGENEDLDFDTLTVDPQGVMRDPKGRFVPHAAMHRAREQFKSARDRANTTAQENAQLREQMATLTGRFEQLNQLVRPPEATPPAPAPEPEDVAPDPQVDIFGYVAWQGRQMVKLQQRVEKAETGAKEEVNQVRGQLSESQMMTSYRQDAQNFHAAKPEFRQAYDHLVNGRNAELAMMGYNDPNQRASIIHNEEKELVQTAFRQGKRPAEFVYNVAVTRGFRAPAAPPPPNPAPPPAAYTPPPPAAVPPVAVQVPVPANLSPAAIQLQNQAAARAASATLSGAGGASGDGLTAEAIGNMSESEFEALYNKLGGKRGGMRQFMGA